MKKEIYCGFDLTEFNRIRDALDNAKINHTNKVVDLITPSCLAGELSGTRTASGVNAPAKQYYVYVSNDNFEKVSIIIRKER